MGYSFVGGRTPYCCLSSLGTLRHLRRAAIEHARESFLERHAVGTVEQEVACKVDDDHRVADDHDTEEDVERLGGAVVVGAGDHVQDRRRTDEQEV